MSVKTWGCLCCGVPLGTVNHGTLYPLGNVPIRLAKTGGAWVTCRRCLNDCQSALCKKGRGWAAVCRQECCSVIS